MGLGFQHSQASSQDRLFPPILPRETPHEPLPCPWLCLLGGQKSAGTILFYLSASLNMPVNHRGRDELMRVIPPSDQTTALCKLGPLASPQGSLSFCLQRGGRSLPSQVPPQRGCTLTRFQKGTYWLSALGQCCHLYHESVPENINEAPGHVRTGADSSPGPSRHCGGCGSTSHRCTYWGGAGGLAGSPPTPSNVANKQPHFPLSPACTWTHPWL